MKQQGQGQADRNKELGTPEEMTGGKQEGLGPSFLLQPGDLPATGKANREKPAEGKDALQSPSPAGRRVIVLGSQVRY